MPDIDVVSSRRPAEGPTVPLLRATGLTKRFFGHAVLQDIDLELHPGTVHGLVGENGAGKSTLMKILAGVYQPDGGTVEISGERKTFGHPVQSQQAGLSTVFQEFNLLPDRTVAENIYLGREPRRGALVDTGQMQRDTAELLDGLGVTNLSPTTMVGSLSVAEQQIVEIAKAVSYDARIIQMDEPTAALADHEVALLYGMVRRLQERGVAVLYVSHRLTELFDLCETITVLKDGRHVATRPADELDEATLVRMMVGREMSAFFPNPVPGTALGAEVLTLTGAGNDYVDGIDLTLRGGEIVGLAGLQGSGRTELVEGIFGAQPFTRGAMTLSGRTVQVSSPRQAIRRGLALVTEDRKAKGLSLNQSILDNALGVVRAVFPGRTGTARRRMPQVLSSMSVAARGLDQEVQFLSGGNQQKVVLARWLSTNPQVMLMDEPTRGIDVGAKHSIYELMRQLAADGVAILMVSSELPEVIGMSDRILVMHEGRLAGELPAGSTEEEILQLATGTPHTTTRRTSTSETTTSENEGEDA
ncbi:sugar ABC transporter ATP-binding protein [Ornithinimicrobium cryptoxanthini]|uniref:Sugar ABC transporter ATP-binding protein n=1 Tax=Ornithinimicrobium cryptoxanthini TaxID=2934161 RepID=A0ABY4YKS0_9MICO|nr:sugar ABC transporter ATP-binding protein [Ornithinimicrobium cryptoxanthini]USQ77395.1 sugar ABC transporter ATP-binding protein [Ornithinimicrobium cryptoxanthini]